MSAMSFVPVAFCTPIVVISARSASTFWCRSFRLLRRGAPAGYALDATDSLADVLVLTDGAPQAGIDLCQHGAVGFTEPPDLAGVELAVRRIDRRALACSCGCEVARPCSNNAASSSRRMRNPLLSGQSRFIDRIMPGILASSPPPIAALI